MAASGGWAVNIKKSMAEIKVYSNTAAQVTCTVSGAGKAERLREVLTGPYQPDTLPAQIIRPTDGRLLWMTDETVVAHLRGERTTRG